MTQTCVATTHQKFIRSRHDKKSNLNIYTRARALNADDKWKSILTNVNFYARFHCLRQLIWSNKCKHHVRNLCCKSYYKWFWNGFFVGVVVVDAKRRTCIFFLFIYLMWWILIAVKFDSLRKIDWFLFCHFLRIKYY